jgi:hypothetical protein
MNLFHQTFLFAFKGAEKSLLLEICQAIHTDRGLRNGRRVLFLNSSHHHAKMLAADSYGDRSRLNQLVEGAGNFVS